MADRGERVDLVAHNGGEGAYGAEIRFAGCPNCGRRLRASLFIETDGCCGLQVECGGCGWAVSVGSDDDLRAGVWTTQPEVLQRELQWVLMTGGGA